MTVSTPPGMIFGMELILDLEHCDLELISNEGHLRAFAARLVEVLDMEAYGPAWIQHFGHNDIITSGYTLFQPIQTSSIIGHFSDHLRRAHLNLFSCRAFDAYTAESFCEGFLNGKTAQRQVIVR